MQRKSESNLGAEEHLVQRLALAGVVPSLDYFVSGGGGAWVEADLELRLTSGHGVASYQFLVYWGSS
jgi:hypothetical protein